MKFCPHKLASVLLTATLLTSSSRPIEPVQNCHEFTSLDTTVNSRGVPVPLTFVHPILDTTRRVPVVIMAHGHGGNRDEAGGFTRMAEALAQRGIASVRMDFPGCGDSQEPFTQNNLGNMVKDLLAARDFAIRKFNGDLMVLNGDADEVISPEVSGECGDTHNFLSLKTWVSSLFFCNMSQRYCVTSP